MKKAIFLFLAITTLVACKKDPVNESIALIGKSYCYAYKNLYNQNIFSTIYFEAGNNLRLIQTRDVVNGEVTGIANGTYTYNHPYIYIKIRGTTELTGKFIDNKTIIVESDDGKNYIYKLVE